MAILGKFGLSGALDKVLDSGELDSPEIAQALQKILSSRKEATERVLQRIDSGPRLQYSAALKLLGQLLDNSTIDLAMRALPTYIPATQKDVATLLNTNKSFDPHLVLPYLKESLSLQIARDMIMAHRNKFTAVKLLKAVTRTRQELWEIIFELVHNKTEDAAFPEAVALTKSKSPVMREHAAGVIAEFTNPAAIEILQTLLSDKDKNVYLAALRGLTRMQASLPAADIFQLMQKMSKDEAPLVTALLKYCKDPRLIEHLSQAMFGKSAKLRPFAAQGLALIATQDNLREVFLNLSEKPQSMHTNIIQTLLDHGGERFIDLIAILADDTDNKVRNIAIEAIELSDPTNPKIIAALRKHVGNDIPADIKASFINKLAQAKDKAAVPALIKILAKDSEQRVVTLQALEQIADNSALADVFEILADKNTAVQRAALSCLSQLIPKKFAKKIRKELIANMGKISEDALPSLADLLATITEKYRLPETVAYQQMLEKLEETISGELTLDSPMITPGNSNPFDGEANSPFGGNKEDPFGSPEDNPFGGNADDPFGGAGDNPFGNAEREPTDTGTSQTAASESKQEEDFAIDLVPGIVLSKRYKLVREIGRGGYGSVWLVEDTFIKEELVMKFLHQQLVSDEVAIERFIRELRMARKVTHPNIIRLFDYLDLGNIAAISMEYFAGKALSAVINEGAIAPERVVKLCRIVSLALESAHQADVVHRDLKPANIMVDDNDMVKIVDFGIAAASKHAESRLTRTGTLVGTPTYISPEQIQGKKVDGRTDMYSLGIIMYQMLTGEPPYRSEDSMALVFMHVEGKARRVEDVNPLVPKELADVVHRCLAPDPDKRYQSMAELAQVLATIGPT